jgi:hypothetical protein
MKPVINPLRINLMYRIFLFVFVLFIACTEGNPTPENQNTKVIQATTTRHEERARLQTMHDSLQSEIQRTISLGIAKEQAESIERARIKTQETIVMASERNLAAQRAFLDSLTKYHP